MTDTTAPEEDVVYKTSKSLVLPCLREIRDLLNQLIQDIEAGSDEVRVHYRGEISSVRPKPPNLCNCHDPKFFRSFLPSEVIERLAPLLAGIFRGLGR